MRRIREEFLKDIKRDIININFLVQSLLKLSKFDANTINFSQEKTTINKLVDTAIEKSNEFI